MPIPILERTGNASAAGIAKEAVFGTAVLPTNFEPMTDLSIVPDPGLFYPQVMMGVRDANVFPLYGQTKLAGALGGPLFPVNGIPMWVGVVGTDLAVTGTPVAPGAIVTGTLGAVAAGTTALTWTVTAGAPAAGGGEFYMIGPAIVPNTTAAGAAPTATTFTDTGAAFGVNALKGYLISVNGGLSTALIVSNTATVITIKQWSGVIPGATSPYVVIPVPGSATAAGAQGSQVVKTVSYVTGAGGFVISAPLQFKIDTAGNGAAGLVGQKVTAPFYHNIVPSNASLNSYTIEKNMAGYQSEQYAGCRVDKFSLKLPTANSEASFTADLMAKSVAILNTPSAITVDTAVPFMFTEGTVALNGLTSANLTQCTNVEFTVENTIKDTYSITNATLPTFLTPTTRKVTGKLTMIWVSNNDTDYGYFTKMVPSLAAGGAPLSYDLSLTLTHPAGAGIFQVDFPQINLSKVGDEIKIGDVIMQVFDFTAAYSIASATVMSSYVANSAFQAY